MAGTSVITIVPEDVPRLEQAKRFAGIQRVIVFLAANWEEYGLWDRGAILANTTKNPMVVHSKHSYEEVLASAKELLSPAKQVLLRANLHLIPYGVGEEFQPVRRNERLWIVPYNRVNQSQKNFSLHRELSSKFNVLLKGEVSHKFILMDAAGFEKDADLSLYEVVKQPATREEYLQEIAECGAFLCTSNYESFGIYYLELLCSGAVGVFMDKPWIRRLLPEYPLVASTKQEALSMMLDVTRDYDKWYSLISSTVVPYIRQNYRLSAFVSRLLSI